MPISGTRPARSTGDYSKHPMYKFAQQFQQIQKGVLNESNVDVFYQPQVAYQRPASQQALEEFFVTETCDINDPLYAGDPAAIQDQQHMMQEQFLNDVYAMQEATAPAEYNPVVGMTLPVHKNILMNMIFDKGAIQKVTAVSPKFTESMEIRLLVTPDGKTYDMFLEQNMLTQAIDSSVPVTEFNVGLPHKEEDTDFLSKLGGTDLLDSLDIVQTYISALKVSDVYFEIGDILPDASGYLTSNGVAATAAQTLPVYVPVELRMEPGYTGIATNRGIAKERTCLRTVPFTYKHLNATTGKAEQKTIAPTIVATMDHNKIMIQDTQGIITEVKLRTRLDTSNAMQDTCKAEWKVNTQLVEIGTTPAINTTISPTEIKDLAALYDVNQLTKLMSLFKTSLANYKDDKILEGLKNSFLRLDARNKAESQFDYKPRADFALDPITWRHTTFMDLLDRVVTKMLYALNDPNMTITVFGDPDVIRRIGPTKYEYDSPKEVGQVTLDFTRGVTTSNGRTYHFMGSDKLRNTTELIIILCPQNSQRIVYRIYDYQMYVSNEIRNHANPALPAINAFERWLFFELQPVQGRVELLNSRLEDMPTVNA